MKKKITTLSVVSIFTIGLLPAGLTSCGTKDPEIITYTITLEDLNYTDKYPFYAESLKNEKDINPDKLIINGDIFKNDEQFGGFNYDKFNKPMEDTPNFFNEKNNNIKTLEIDFSSLSTKGTPFNGSSEHGYYLPTLGGSNVNHVILRPLIRETTKYSTFLLAPYSTVKANTFSTNSKTLRVDFYGSLNEREGVEWSSGGEFTQHWAKGGADYSKLFTRKDGTTAVENLEIHILKTEDRELWSTTYLFPLGNIVADLSL